MNGIPCTRSSSKWPLLEKCFERYDKGEYIRMRFLRGVRHSIMQAQQLQIPDNSDEKTDTADNAADADFGN